LLFDGVEVRLLCQLPPSNSNKPSSAQTANPYLHIARQAFATFCRKMGLNSTDELLAFKPLVTALLGYHLLPTANSSEQLLAAAPATGRPFSGGAISIERMKGLGGPQAASPEAQLNFSSARNSAGCQRMLDAGRSYVHVIDQVGARCRGGARCIRGGGGEGGGDP